MNPGKNGLIRQWYDTLRSGGSVQSHDPETADLQLATVRFLNGLGPWEGGEDVYAVIEAALGDGEGSTEDRHAAATAKGMR